jgi:IS30 family transposase
MLSLEEDVEAQGLRDQGWSISAIARHLGRDRKTINYAEVGIIDRLAVHAQAGRDLALRATRIPVDQDLGHIRHVERSPRHLRSPVT